MTDWPPDPFDDDAPPDREDAAQDSDESQFRSEWQFDALVGEAWETSRERAWPKPD